MLTISEQNIALNQQAIDKATAIEFIANQLKHLGYVQTGFAQAMLAREKQTTTYLGNGIAIPHGTLAARNLINQTGVFIAQYPQGIDWGNGEKAFIIIGIAAQSDEHLAILRRITELLSDEHLAKKLAETTNVSDFIEIFQPTEKIINPALISLHLPSQNLLTLTAENVSQLQQYGYCNDQFLNNVLAQQPLEIAPNCYLTDSAIGNEKAGLALARNQQGTVMLTISQTTSQLTPLLLRLDDHICRQLQTLDKPELIALLENIYAGKSIEIPPPASNVETQNETAEHCAEFIIQNPHGLHARPATNLVKIAKKFSCTIQFSTNNVDWINGKNLMKLLTLGVKAGQTLYVKADGNDAIEAINAIGQGIADKLGE